MRDACFPKIFSISIIVVIASLLLSCSAAWAQGPKTTAPPASQGLCHAHCLQIYRVGDSLRVSVLDADGDLTRVDNFALPADQRSDTKSGPGAAKQSPSSGAAGDEIHAETSANHFVLKNGNIVVSTLIKVYRGDTLLSVDTHVTRVPAEIVSKAAAAAP